eukprot:Gb_05627 [translate_table: standard]
MQVGSPFSMWYQSTNLTKFYAGIRKEERAKAASLKLVSIGKEGRICQRNVYERSTYRENGICNSSENEKLKVVASFQYIHSFTSSQTSWVYLALSGAPLDGVEMIATGLATHFVPSEKLLELEKRLIDLNFGDKNVVKASIEEFSLQDLALGRAGNGQKYGPNDETQDLYTGGRRDGHMRKFDQGVASGDIRRDLVASHEREVALMEKKQKETELQKRIEEAKQREADLKNDLASMWVVVAKLKKGQERANEVIMARLNASEDSKSRRIAYDNTMPYSLETIVQNPYEKIRIGEAYDNHAKTELALPLCWAIGEH